MKLLGRIQNGVVVFDEGTAFPEGMRVYVFPVQPESSEPEIAMQPGELPLVRGGAQGSVQLTNERLNEIFEDEDVAYGKDMVNVPS